MTKSLNIVLGFLALVSASCAESPATGDEACDSPLIQGARSIVDRAPEGMDLRLGPWYRDTEIPDTLAASLLEATGLRLASQSEIEARDPDLAVLHAVGLLQNGDTIEVGFDWIRLTGGDGGAWWGQEYRVSFVCRSGCCEHVGTRMSGTWN